MIGRPAAFFLLTILLPAQEENPPINGITVSTHRSGQDWGSDRMADCIQDIQKVGANWISIHPYASIRRNGEVTWRKFEPESPPAYLTRPIREAQARGVKIFIKPHLAYWGSGFSWRGEITFETTEQWDRFFRTYEAWIVAVAAACKAADGFSVGTELDLTIHREAEWRRIIRSVRAVTDAPLTYAANWTDYQKVGFWDALNIIGIQAYFPLTNKKKPTDADLRAGWQRTMETLEHFSVKQERNVVFTELGYNTAFETATEPWDHKSDGPAAEPAQLACMRAALRAIADHPRVEGAFLWKWFPPPSSVGRNFPLATPGMKKTIADAWLSPGKEGEG